VNELGDCFILQGPSLGSNLSCHNGRPWEWEDPVVKAKKPVRGKNNWTWARWRNWNDPYWMDSTKRKGKNNLWDSSSSISLHILCCLQTYSFVQRNLNKGVLICIGGGRFNYFLLQLSLPFGSTFPPPTLDLCSYKACKSLHERLLDVFPQWNL